MTNTTFKSIPEGTPMLDDLAVVRAAVEDVAATNRALMAEERAAERTSAAQAFRMQLRESLRQYGCDITECPQHIIDDNSVVLMEVARGTLSGIGLQGVAERLTAQIKAYNEAKDEQQAKTYSVSVVLRKDGTVSRPWLTGDTVACAGILKSERADNVKGYASKELSGFTSDADARDLLLNPVAVKKMFGAEVGAHGQLPSLKQTADSLGLSYYAPQTTDTVIVVLLDGAKVTKKSKVINAVACPLLQVPQLMLRDFGTVNLTENAQAHYLVNTVPNPALAKEIAYIIANEGLTGDMEFTTDLSEVLYE